MYAQALKRALKHAAKEKHEMLLDNLISLMQCRGHRALLPHVLKAYEKTVSRTQENGVLEVARAEDAEAHRESIARACKQLGLDPVALTVRVNSHLIGGYVIRKAGEQVDGSFRRGLLEMYQKIRAA